MAGASDNLTDSTEDLAAFKVHCIDRHSEIEDFALRINRLSLWSGRITSLRVVKRSYGRSTAGQKRPTYQYLLADVVLPEKDPNTSKIQSLFGLQVRDGMDHLALRVEVITTAGDPFAVPLSLASGDDGAAGRSPTYLPRRFRTTFVCDLKRIRNAHLDTISRATFGRLRVYHLLDLLRVVHTRVSDNQTPTTDRVDSWLPGEVLAHLADCSSSTKGGRPGARGGLPSTLIRQFDDAFKLFKSRWFACGPVAGTSGHGKPTLSALPLDRGPLFCFNIPETSYYRLLSSSRHDGVIRRSLTEFYQHILSPVDPPEACARVTSCSRYERKNRYRHQFVVFSAELSVEGLHVNRTLWFRIDRAADTTSDAFKRRGISTSTFPACDTVQIALSESNLFIHEERCRTISSTPDNMSPDPSTNRVTIRRLAKTLETFRSVSGNYGFFTENCYYLAALIEDLIMPKSRSIGHPSWAQLVPTKTRELVLEAFRAASNERFQISVHPAVRNASTSSRAIILPDSGAVSLLRSSTWTSSVRTRFPSLGGRDRSARADMQSDNKHASDPRYSATSRAPRSAGKLKQPRVHVVGERDTRS